MVDISATPLIAPADLYTSASDTSPPVTFAMAPRRPSGRMTAMVVASGVADWVFIVAAGVGGYYLGDTTPNKRPFQLEDPDIS